MAAIWWLAILCWSAFGLEARAQDVMACYRGTECPQGFYCMSHTGYCHRCLDCSAYKRRPSESDCVRSQSQCGTCLDGYFLPPHSSHMSSSNYFCLSINTTEYSPQTGSDSAATNPTPMVVAYVFIGIIILGFVGLILISLIYKKKYFYRRSEHVERIVARDVEESLCQPPSYSQAVCSAPSLIVNRDYLNTENNFLDEESTVGLVVCRKERETNQAATCFRVPSCQRRLNLPLDDVEEIGSNHSAEPTELTPVIEQDENTMESIWTSNAVASNEEVNLSSALTEAAGARLITQPDDNEDASEIASPPKRVRIHEELPNENAGTQSRDPASEKVSFVEINPGNMTMPSISSTSNGTISVDLNENILNQSSIARFNRYHQADNSPSSDEDETTSSTNQSKFFSGNVVVVIQQNMKVKK